MIDAFGRAVLLVPSIQTVLERKSRMIDAFRRKGGARFPSMTRQANRKRRTST
jgi:hypothetical protein